MPKRRTFISFKSEDQAQVNGLRLLAANDRFDIEFFDSSVRTAIRSNDRDYIRRRIREKLDRTTVTICMIGKNTYKSEWVQWELEQSFARGNAVICMALKGIDSAVLPQRIKEAKLTFHPWDHEKLARLISEL